MKFYHITTKSQENSGIFSKNYGILWKNWRTNLANTWQQWVLNLSKITGGGGITSVSSRQKHEWLPRTVIMDPKRTTQRPRLLSIPLRCIPPSLRVLTLHHPNHITRSRLIVGWWTRAWVCAEALPDCSKSRLIVGWWTRAWVCAEALPDCSKQTLKICKPRHTSLLRSLRNF